MLLTFSPVTFLKQKYYFSVFTLTTSYWYISGAQYKIQGARIFSPHINVYYIQFVFFFVITIVITLHTKLRPQSLCSRIWSQGGVSGLL